MALTSVIPDTGSIINTGDTITVVTDDAGGVANIYYSGTGSTEVLFRDSTGYSTGYAGSYAEVGGSATAAFRRNAGWDSSPFSVSVETASATYTVTYTLLAEGQYPPDMQPFNDPVPDTGSADIAIQDDGSPQGTATTINYAAGLTAIVSGGVAQIDAAVGTADVSSSESSGTVADNEIAVFDGTTGKLIKGGNPGTYTYPGGLIANNLVGQLSVVSNGFMWVTGDDAGMVVSENTDMPALGGAGTGVFWVKESGTDANTPMFTDGEGTEIDLTAAAGGGDVSSSESDGTVQNSEIAVFDGTGGKTIKGASTGTYVNSSGVVTAAGFSTTSGRVTAGEAIRLNGPTAYYYASEWASGNPSPEGSGGQYWCKSPEHSGTPQTRPMFTADDGTNYDLSEGSGGYSSLTDFNADISPNHVSNVHIQSSAPAVAVDGDIWIETT